MPNVLVFSVALNGYQWRYRELLDSHRRYAEIHRYNYVAVTRPGWSLLGMEVAWLKIRLIIEALNSDFDTILFIDADARISENTPPVESVIHDEKDIYAAKGYSGRLNSGVLLVKQSAHAKEFFTDLLNIATHPLPQADDVGWGENGHLIYLAKNDPRFGVLHARWNNNHQKALEDYIRHYSHGPLHSEYSPPIMDHIMDRSCHYALACMKRINRIFQYTRHSTPCTHNNFQLQLEQLSQKVFDAYPVFKHATQTSFS
mgnify:CR=1 FL=1